MSTINMCRLNIMLKQYENKEFLSKYCVVYVKQFVLYKKFKKYIRNKIQY